MLFIIGYILGIISGGFIVAVVAGANSNRED